MEPRLPRGSAIAPRLARGSAIAPRRARGSAIAPRPAGGSAVSRFLLVRAGDALCALPLEQVRRVVRALIVHALPGSSAELLGLAEFAGEPLPVLELARLVGGAGGSLGGSSVTVVARLGRAEPAEIVGLQADEALEIVELPTPTSSAGGTRGLLAGESLSGGRRVSVLDLAAWAASA